MKILEIFHNPILGVTLLAPFIAQAIKLPLDFIQRHRWNWSLILEPGGMPSSHSALVTAAAHAIGLWVGFDSPLYALAFGLCIVVIYDATGIRRQAGMHAEIINHMIQDLATGHPLKSQELREVLGHTPLEALAGIIIGLLVAQVSYLILR
jgi:uncharacterized protein